MNQRIFWTEWIKLRRSKLWIWLVLFSLLPVIYGVFIHSSIMTGIYGYDEGNQWLMLTMMVVLFYGTIFAPVITAITARTLNDFEKVAGNWQKLKLSPIGDQKLFISKWCWLVMLMAGTQCLTFVLIIQGGYLTGIQDNPLWTTLLSTFLLGTIGIIALGTLQLYMFLRSSSTTLTLTVNICLAFPVFLIFSNTEGSLLPYLYPWALPVIGMTEATTGGLHVWTFLFTCIGMIVLFIFLGSRQITQKGK